METDHFRIQVSFLQFEIYLLAVLTAIEVCLELLISADAFCVLGHQVVIQNLYRLYVYPVGLQEYIFDGLGLFKRELAVVEVNVYRFCHLLL